MRGQFIMFIYTVSNPLYGYIFNYFSYYTMGKNRLQHFILKVLDNFSSFQFIKFSK